MKFSQVPVEKRRGLTLGKTAVNATGHRALMNKGSGTRESEPGPFRVAYCYRRSRVTHFLTWRNIAHLYGSPVSLYNGREFTSLNASNNSPEASKLYDL